MIYDSIIIGKGPAGIQAALYMKRANLHILVIGKDGGSLEKAEKIENFYGQENVISGKDLVEKGIAQIKRLGVDVITDEVVAIEYIENKEESTKFNLLFKIKTLKTEYLSKTVLISTGVNRKAPSIPGLKEFEGRGVSYCAICDGFFYRDKEVAVIGNGNYAISEVEALLPVTNKITVLTNGKSEVLVRDKDIKCNSKEILSINGDKKVEKVVFKDNTEMDVNGIFIAEGSASSVDFARKLGAEIAGNSIIVNEKNMETSVEGLFAAGDCTGGENYQIAKAVYEGMKAGLGIVKYVKSNV